MYNYQCLLMKLCMASMHDKQCIGHQIISMTIAMLQTVAIACYGISLQFAPVCVHN